MKKKTTLTLAAGAAFVATAAFAPIAGAADNPFGMAKLDSGYQLAQADKKADDKKKDGKCGEGKCGGSMAGDKKPADDKKKDGKCGEGKCGGTKK